MTRLRLLATLLALAAASTAAGASR